MKIWHRPETRVVHHANRLVPWGKGTRVGVEIGKWFITIWFGRPLPNGQAKIYPHERSNPNMIIALDKEQKMFLYSVLMREAQELASQLQAKKCEKIAQKLNLAKSILKQLYE